MLAARFLPAAALLLFAAGTVQGAARPVTLPLRGCVDRRLTVGAGQLRLVDSRRRSVLYTYSDSGLPGDMVVQTSPVCCLFLVRDPGRLLQVVSADTGAVLKTLSAKEGADTAQVVFSPGACAAAVAEWEMPGVRTLSLVSGTTGGIVATFPGLRNLSLQFSPHGDAIGIWEIGRSFRIAAGETGEVRYIDADFDLSQGEAEVRVSDDCALFRLVEESESDPQRRWMRVVNGDSGRVLSQIPLEESEAIRPRSQFLTYPVDPGGAGSAQWSVSDSGAGLVTLETGEGDGAGVGGAEVVPRTLDPVVFTVTPERVNAPFRAEATAVDAAGNCRHCRVIGTAVRTSRGRSVITQVIRDVPPTHGEVLLLNGTPGAWLVQVTANRRSFRTVLKDGERQTIDISAALTRPLNLIKIRALGRPGAALNLLLQEPSGL